jgi:cation:H+ antiporter
MALLNLISSKVNQWTLLVGMIPLAYSVSLGHWQAIPLDARHQEELLLSLMMTLYGGVTLLKLRFTRLNAISLLALWLIQFVFPHQLPLLGDGVWNNTRLLTSFAFGILIGVELTIHWRDIRLIENLRVVARTMRFKSITTVKA